MVHRADQQRSDQLGGQTEEPQEIRVAILRSQYRQPRLNNLPKGTSSSETLPATETASEKYPNWSRLRKCDSNKRST